MPLVRDRLAERADLVDMEGYAVAFACRRLGVPVRLVKHVSDRADDSALDWPTSSTPAPARSAPGSPPTPDRIWGRFRARR